MSQTEKATFAAGCFWGIEHKFRQMDGVVDTQVGYTGGKTDDPSYKEVCGKGTGHAEAVEVTFKPGIISYDALLEAFWKMHDPTQLNRQGPDVGDQYRSAVFYHDDTQKQAAEASKSALQDSGAWGDKDIVTLIEPAGEFWRAEEYHQRYVEKQGGSHCSL